MADKAQAANHAALALAQQRWREHEMEADRYKAMTVYVDSAGFSEDAPEGVRILEVALRDGIRQQALFHDREAVRLAEAIEKINGIINPEEGK